MRFIFNGRMAMGRALLHVTVPPGKVLKHTALSSAKNKTARPPVSKLLTAKKHQSLPAPDSIKIDKLDENIKYGVISSALAIAVIDCLLELAYCGFTKTRVIRLDSPIAIYLAF